MIFFYTITNLPKWTFASLEGEIDLVNGDSKITLTFDQSSTVEKVLIHGYEYGPAEIY